MPYHILSESAELNEIGNDYPQIQNVSKDYDPDGPKSVYRLYEYRNLSPPFVPELDSFRVRKRTKMTDLMSNVYIGGRGLFLSDRFKAILSDFNLPNHRFFRSTVIKDNAPYTYYWFHLIQSDYRKNVVFPKTTFSNWRNLRLNNYEDYLEFASKDDKFGQLRAETVTLDKIFDKSLDLFMISAFDQELYISERLKDRIIKENITGIEVKSSDGRLRIED